MNRGKILLGTILIVLAGGWSFFSWILTAIQVPSDWGTWFTPQAIAFGVVGVSITIIGAGLIILEVIRDSRNDGY